MEAFGDHLGADEDRGFLFFESVVDLFETFFAAGGVFVGAEGFCFREEFLDFFFDALGADAEVANVWALAMFANCRRGCDEAAVVANERAAVVVLVVGESGFALAAGFFFTAITANDGG